MDWFRFDDGRPMKVFYELGTCFMSYKVMSLLFRDGNMS